MKINVKSNELIPLYPEIEGNEDNQFVIWFKRQPAFVIADSYDPNGDDGISIDKQKYCELTIEKMDNPPILVIDGEERESTVSDIFTIPELSSVAWQCWAHALKVNSGNIDKKK
jgi:hypothetical protein